MSIKSVIGAAALAVLTAVPASALVMQSQSGVMTKVGQNFNFNFTGLPASDGTGGMITIASGPATTGGLVDAGFDLDGIGEDGAYEFMSVKADGSSLGMFSCGAARGTSIPGFTMNGQADCIFSLKIALSGSVLDGLIGDGAMQLLVDFARGVGHFGDGDQLDVSLAYNEVIPAPLPATGLLLLGGLLAVGAASRRKRA